MSKVDAQFLVTLAVAFFCICKVGSPQNVLGSSLQYNIGLFYTLNRALLHRTQGSIQTEEIGLKTITTAKISNKFSQESPYIKLNMFSRESPKFVTGLQVSKRSPRHSKEQAGKPPNLEIQVFWKSDLLREWMHENSLMMLYKFQVSFAEYSLFYRALLQKRLIILAKSALLVS